MLDRVRMRAFRDAGHTLDEIAVAVGAAKSSYSGAGEITLTAYDADDVEVDSATMTLANSLQQIGVSGSGLARVVVSSPVTIFVIDDLAFGPVCAELTLGDCVELGGTYDGDGSPCSP